MSIDLAYRRYCKRRFPLPTEDQLRELERRIKVSFPDDFRRYVLDFNGGYFKEPEIMPTVEGCPADSLLVICGIVPSHEEAELGSALDLSLFDDNEPPQILPIGETPLGSLIILDVAPGDGRGQIYFKEAFGDFYFLADGIEQFFGLLRDPIPE